MPALQDRALQVWMYMGWVVNATHLFEERCYMLLWRQHIRRHYVLVAPTAAADPAVKALTRPLDVDRPNVLLREKQRAARIKKKKKHLAETEGVKKPFNERRFSFREQTLR